MQALFSTFLRLYIIFFAVGQTKKFGVIMGFLGYFLVNFAPFSGNSPIFLLGIPCHIWAVSPRNPCFFGPFTPALPSFLRKIFSLFLFDPAQIRPAF